MANWCDDKNQAHRVDWIEESWGGKPREPFQTLFWVALGYMTVVIGGCLYALKRAGLW